MVVLTFLLSKLTAIMRARSAISSTYTVQNTLFYHISSSSDGGAIYLSTSSADLTASYCLFHKCTSSADGGAVYASNGDTLIHFCCFYKCYVAATSSEDCGHAFHLDSDSAVSNTSYFEQCSPSSSYAASVIIPFSLDYGVKYDNFTQCCGTSLMRLSLITNIQIGDKAMNYAYALNCTVSYYIHQNTLGFGDTHCNINLIGNTLSTAFYQVATLVPCTVSNSYFFGNSYSSFSSGFLFSNCYADFSALGINQASTTVTAGMSVLNRDICILQCSGSFTSEDYLPYVKSSVVLSCGLYIMSVLYD